MAKSFHGPKSGAIPGLSDPLASGPGTPPAHIDTNTNPLGGHLDALPMGGRGHGLPSGEVFGFTIASGTVTAAKITTPMGTVVDLPLTSGVTYSVSGTDVLATKVDADSKEVVRYSDADVDGLYQAVAASEVFTTAPTKNALGFTNRETLKVTLTGTVVTGVTETMPNGTQKVALSSMVTPTDTTWTITNGLLVETHTSTSGAVQYEIFRDGNGDGVYTEVAHGMGALVDLVGVVAATDLIAGSL